MSDTSQKESVSVKGAKVDNMEKKENLKNEKTKETTESVSIEREELVGGDMKSDESQSTDRNEDELHKLLESTKEKMDEYVDKFTRSQADIENLKRRHLKELENARKYGIEKFASELLSIWDSLELGLVAAASETSNIDSLKEGMDLTLKMLSDVMKNFGIEQIDPIDQKFNPEIHQAISAESRDDCEPNIVISVVQKGYSLNGRLIRPAMVIVSK